ncbi:hypothetical protein BLL42_21460 [Pseudomonas frederiksbergensis]|uniref:Uncharacterized protein n=1 Tax=Pseudomonas frederiksbergensis TaxID=104087 RepID=A0A1J0EPU5_9PSED|nr:hypothetical protein [Pseudomonas frederiksbergensis]APC18165.1 hypothetical protein BLL42_21460 [Pseudomonas frederiksbergensis]
MEYKKAEIVAHTGDGEKIRLSDIPFHFSPGERSPYIGADNSGGIVQRAGWLGLQTEAFQGWYGTHIIELTYPNGRDGDHVFEVKRNFKNPIQEDGWLWFPAMPLGVTPYSEHD